MATERGIKQRVGDRFGRLVIISSNPERRLKEGKKKLWWLCRCDCGQESFFLATRLRGGRSTSCGCKRLESLKPGNGANAKYSVLTTSPNGRRTYASYQSMLARCTDTRSQNFKNYGGRGIVVCDRWRQSYQNFLDDMGLRPAGTTIGRENNNGNYEPENCRWETNAEQSGNKRNTVFIEGEKLIDICDKTGRDRNTVYQRHVALGWPIEKALRKPTRKSKKKLPTFIE